MVGSIMKVGRPIREQFVLSFKNNVLNQTSAMGNDGNFEESGSDGGGEKWTVFKSFFGGCVHRAF